MRAPRSVASPRPSRGADLRQTDLFAAPQSPTGATAVQGHATPGWIEALLASPVYDAQHRLAGRSAPPADQLRAMLSALMVRGGRLSRTALAQALSTPLFRIGGLVNAARRVLNVDQAQILAIDGEDELHAFAGDDRGWHLLFLLGRIERLAGGPLQRIGLSATIGNPEEVLGWLTRGRGGQVIGTSELTSDGEVTADYVGSLANAVTVLARLFHGERRLVFAESRSRVEQLTEGLRMAGVRAFASHASLSADQRRAAEAAFAAEPDCAIVATSTLELGIDVGDLDRVVQVGAPATVTSFLQRMGRTGRRAGSQPNCLFLATDDEELLTVLAIATLWREGVVEPVTPPKRPAHIYAQQIMALALQLGGVARPDLETWLGGVAAEVPEDDRLAVVRHMLNSGVLAEDGGVFGLGERGEQEFGRRHFSDLVAAFSNPLMLTVHHGVAELGTVHPTSLSRGLGAAAPVLLLGGRSWEVVEVDWPHRRVSVVPAKGGGRSRWLGSGRTLSTRICHAAERIVSGAAPSCKLSRRATERLAKVRERLAFIDGCSLPVVADEDGAVRVWPFAGGLVSASLERALARSGLASIR